MANLHLSTLHVITHLLSSILPLLTSAAPMPGSEPWKAAYSKAVALVSKMTLEERANITVGYPPTTGCSGETGSVPRLNWVGLCLQDAGQGVRRAELVNSYPSGLHVGASWNRDLAHKRGLHMGGEFKTKGIHVALGPVVGPLGRVYLGGRNWEGFASDRKSDFVLIPESQLQRSQVCETIFLKHFPTPSEIRLMNEQRTSLANLVRSQS